MKLESKVTALERSSTASAKLCSVTYKANQGPEGEIFLPMDKALQEARTGHVKEIRFPLTFNEEQAERLYSRNQLDKWFADYKDGIRRDTEPPSTGSLILCSQPVVFARQAPPRGGVGGHFITEGGTPFHQSQWREILTKYNAGFYHCPGLRRKPGTLAQRKELTTMADYAKDHNYNDSDFLLGTMPPFEEHHRQIDEADKHLMRYCEEDRPDVAINHDWRGLAFNRVDKEGLFAIASR